MIAETKSAGEHHENPGNAAIRFFDERAADYDREYKAETPGGFALRVRREKVLELFDQPGGKVLDVGCGPGQMALGILQLDCSFWGVDPSEKMIEICQRRFPGQSRTVFHTGDATRLALQDGSFDAVLCMGVIDALHDGSQAVGEMLRVTRPGGTLIITFTNRTSPYAWWKGKIFYPAVSLWHRLRARLSGRRRGAAQKLGGKTRTLYTASEATALLQSRGAVVTDIVPFYYNVFLSPLDELFPSFALWVNRKLESGRLPRPRWIASGLIVKAHKTASAEAGA